jgi:DNA-binding NarL/FixJ family response regulator
VDVTISVVVAEDQSLVRAGLRGIIETAPDLRVTGEAANGMEAVDLAVSQRPDVMLMDIRMPGMDGLSATLRITSATDVRVLILTTFDLDEYIFEALRLGASGFLLKDTPPLELLAAIRSVAAGDALLSPGVTRKLIKEFAARPATSHSPDLQALDGITNREREVLALVAEGLSNREVAARLHIEPGTVKTHIAHLLTKLDVRDRVQLVILAFRCGLVSTS